MTTQLGLFDDLGFSDSADPVGSAPVPEALVEAARALPEGVRLGTSSWSFPGWAGLVYDRTVSQATLARHGLGAYAAHPLLRTVGVDRTYYRPMPASEFRVFADSVPESFRFVVKADRLLTSPTAPGPGSFRGTNPRFLDAEYAAQEVVGPVTEGLGAKAGPILFQFSPIPPNLVGGQRAFATRLHDFLTSLPTGPLYAVELRTPGFLTSDYVQAMHSVGAAHCYCVHPSMSSLEDQIQAVSPFEQPALVVRWMLHAGLRYEAARDRYAPFDRVVDEDDDSLERITVAAFDALIAERNVFVVVNNKAEGSAPRSVFRLAHRLAGWKGPS